MLKYDNYPYCDLIVPFLSLLCSAKKCVCAYVFSKDRKISDLSELSVFLFGLIFSSIQIKIATVEGYIIIDGGAVCYTVKSQNHEASLPPSTFQW